MAIDAGRVDFIADPLRRHPLLKSKPGWSDRTTSWLLLRMFDIKPDFWEYGKP
jgi:hypothetical protein